MSEERRLHTAPQVEGIVNNCVGFSKVKSFLVTEPNEVETLKWQLKYVFKSPAVLCPRQ